MKRRMLSLLIVLCLVIGMVPAVFAAKLDNGLYYQIRDGYVEITYYDGPAAELVIPSEIDGLPVTVIGNRAFDGCSYLTSVSLPSSITTLDEYAFSRCTGLTSISLSSGVTSIGNYAFTRCTSLTGIDIPNSVTSIGQGAFSSCSSLSSISIPEGITQIANYTFESCTSLTSIDIPNSVTSIGAGAFFQCSSLTSIVIPDGVDTILSSTFCGCSALTSVSLPDCLTSINHEAFGDCSSLTNIELPAQLSILNSYAFFRCTGLTSIKIPASVAEIRNAVFYKCTSLTSIYFEGDAPAFSEDLDTFREVTATAYYPAGNPTWTEDVMQDYGGAIAWVPYTPNPFTDVPAGAFYEDPVLWAVENGITNGSTADSFDPNGQCLRAHVVTFLHRAAKNPEPAATNNPFTDVKTTDFFYKPVLWAVEKGITNGVSATRFGSYDVCNRAAVVTFLWRAAGSPEPESTENPFVDVKPTDFFYKPVLWAVENGITNGLSATEFGPTAPCNRAQVVTFLYRAYN